MSNEIYSPYKMRTDLRKNHNRQIEGGGGGGNREYRIVVQKLGSRKITTLRKLFQYDFETDELEAILSHTEKNMYHRQFSRMIKLIFFISRSAERCL